MMKKRLFLMTVLAFAMGTVCHAQVIAPYGPGQIGLSAYVLCENLSLRQGPGYDSPIIQTVKYGDHIIVTDQAEGMARCVLGDAEDSPAGWVNADYLAIDPAWYRTEGDTIVYAWNDTGAPKVGLLDAGMTLPILRDDGDWIVVSLRGAAGWIHDPVRTAGGAASSVSGEAAGSVTGEAAGSAAGTAAENSAAVNAASDGNESGTDAEWFTVYARDGSTVEIRHAGGAMYEDAQGRTYVNQQDEGCYYCITTDITYAFDPTVWTGEIYGENEFPVEGE